MKDTSITKLGLAWFKLTTWGHGRIMPPGYREALLTKAAKR